MNFQKYQGTGNDFVIIDNRDLKLDISSSQVLIEKICSRRFGVGADGFIAVEPSEKADFRMRYLNADGKESTLCGNGTRCVVSFAYKLGIISEEAVVETSVGLVPASIQQDEVRIKMPNPTGYRKIMEENFWVDTGSPHYVQYLASGIQNWDVASEGRKLRHHADFASVGGTNVNFVMEKEPASLVVRTFERGVEAETFSCGTGVTACAFVHQQLHPEQKKLKISTLGGELSVEIKQENGASAVYLQGPAEFVFEGNI